VVAALQAALDEPHAIQNGGVIAAKAVAYGQQTRSGVPAEIHRSLSAKTEMLFALARPELLPAEMKSARDLSDVQ
jgi:hypothetical protein